MLVPLSRGKFALIDNEDYDLISKYTWHVVLERKLYYRAKSSTGLGKKGAFIYMSRLIMNAKPGQVVDHKNGNTLDNQKKNLRFCSHTENKRNCVKHRDSKNPYKGVTKRRYGWDAKISFNKKGIYIGKFATAKKAAIAYDMAAQYFFGEFARLNFTKTR